MMITKSLWRNSGGFCFYCVKYVYPQGYFFFPTHNGLRKNTQTKKKNVAMIYLQAVMISIHKFYSQGRKNNGMSEVIYKVLQDTRNDINPDVCAKCQSPVRPVYASTTNRYHICVYECKKCGNMSFALYEIFEA